MKNLVIILSHCDTEEKIKILEDKLESLNMLGLDVMLLSHCPVSADIQKEVSYFVFDKSNPLLHIENGPLHSQSRTVTAWFEIPFGDNFLEMMSFLPDAGWAVFNKIIKAADLALPLDYDYYSIINYDLDLQPSFVKELINLDFDGDVLLSWSMQDGDDYEETCRNNKPMLGMGKGPGLLFSILKKEAFSEIRRTISREEYLKKDKENALRYEFAEQYWGFLTKPFSASFTEEVSVSTANTLEASDQTARNTEEGDYLFRIFFEGRIASSTIGFPESKTKESVKVFIFDIKSEKPIKFKINGEKIIEVSSPHLEDNVRSIDHLKTDGSNYSFDEEKERATELFNRIKVYPEAQHAH